MKRSFVSGYIPVEVRVDVYTVENEKEVFLWSQGMKPIQHKGKDEETTIQEALKLFEDANGIEVRQPELTK